MPAGFIFFIPVIFAIISVITNTYWLAIVALVSFLPLLAFALLFLVPRGVSPSDSIMDAFRSKLSKEDQEEQVKADENAEIMNYLVEIARLKHTLKFVVFAVGGGYEKPKCLCIPKLDGREHEESCPIGKALEVLQK